jgi:hypothetical protein
MPDYVAEYNRLLAADPAAAREQAEWLHEAFARRGVTFAGTPMASFTRPDLVPRPVWQRLRRDGTRLLELAASVARRAFAGDVARLCRHLGFGEAEARWIAVDPGEPDVLLSRLDAFVTPEGPRFIEVNSDAPAGFGYGDRMAELIAELPVFRAFADRFSVSYAASGAGLVEAVVGLWRRRGGNGLPVVAIVDFGDVKTRADQEILRESFAAKGVACLVDDPRHVELRGGQLFSHGRAVDVVYRRGILPELLAAGDAAAHFLRAYEERAALFVNSFRCQLSEDKAFLALLGDEAFGALLRPDEQAHVTRCVPWTRKVEERRTLHAGETIDLVPWVVHNRERLVLKPAHDYGGRSVCIGDETEPDAWEAAVNAAVGGAWVVQQRVAIPESAFPVIEAGQLAFPSLKVNTNPFYVAGAEVGAVTRCSRSSVINVSAGGGSVPTFVVG